MPARNIIKQYTEDGVYHVYNRGVEKRDIFLDDQDYKYFLFLLKTYLSPPQSPAGFHPEQGETLQREKLNFSDEIELLAYCLMPNHFHLLIRQKNKDSMARFMKSIGTNYSMYFNKKYERVGSLFQGAYKAALVGGDGYLLHLSRYIHLNPVSTTGSHPPQGETLQRGLVDSWSSYGEYLGVRKTKWVKPEFILGMFANGDGLYGEKFASYGKFVEKYSDRSKGEDILGVLKLD